ncbi:MAG TPA: hypothetical protein PLC48_09215 [Ferruginibacter sp.]|nr:hypothetical protein [Ferruginibacter sp.]
MKRKTILYSFITVIIILGALCFVAFREYNRKHVDVADKPAAYTISGAEIIKAFSADEKAANSKYLDKVIAINGTVKSVDKDEQSSITVILSDAGSMSSVRCSVDSIHNEQADNLVSGSQVTVKGVCTGFNADELLGSDVILNRCSIKKINNN